ATALIRLVGALKHSSAFDHTSLIATSETGGVQADSGTIVVVEDDPNIADLVDMYLRREGFRVIQAGDGTAGLDAVTRESPRLVILDVGLPGGLDGLDVCRRLRANDRTAAVPVLMLTARDGEIDRVL